MAVSPTRSHLLCLLRMLLAFWFFDRKYLVRLIIPTLYMVAVEFLNGLINSENSNQTTFLYFSFSMETRILAEVADSKGNSSNGWATVDLTEARWEEFTTWYTLDVLWGQPIKLIQVVSNSEFHEYWWNDLDFFLSPRLVAGPQKPQKLTTSKIKYEHFGPKILIPHWKMDILVT